MGIEELVLHLTKAEGKVEGKVEGKLEEVRNLITKLGLSDEQAADVAGVTIEFVKQVRATLKEQ
jgi:predicted transposase YdaD